jgi:hypothetical protein
MQKLLLLASIILTAIALSCCSRKEVAAVQETSQYTLDEIDSIWRGYPFYVSKAYKITGTDTVDLLKDSIIQIYQNAVFLTFSNDFKTGSITRYGGKPITHIQYPGAKVFDLNMRFSLPTALRFHWDDAKKTIAVESGPNSDLFIIKEGKKGYLDMSKFNISRSFEEAKNAVVPKSMTFIYEDYIIEMRPMFVIGEDPIQTHHKYLVVF